MLDSSRQNRPSYSLIHFFEVHQHHDLSPNEKHSSSAFGRYRASQAVQPAFHQIMDNSETEELKKAFIQYAMAGATAATTGKIATGLCRPVDDSSVSG